MSTVGIIAEYNPFHNGHAYHIAKAKEAAGAQYAAIVMSGDFVQRGEPAMFSKRLRAKWALQNGADIVLSLPVVFSLSSAELFALAGVSLLEATGLVDSLCFGSECGDAAPLSQLAEIMQNEPSSVQSAIRQNLSSGLSYPDARAKAYSSFLGNGFAAALSSPNDILGVEYIRAIKAIGSAMRPIAIPRTGALHDSAEPAGGFMSGSAIRDAVLAGGISAVSGFVPADVYSDITNELVQGRAPRTLSGLSREALYALRRMSVSDLAALPDVSEGLENLLYSACREASSIDELLSLVKTRRYTMARLKRICMCALLGISGEPRAKLPALYIRVLGVRRDAMGLLSQLSASASLPVIARFADASALNGCQLALHALDLAAADIAPLPRPAAFDYSEPLVVV